MAHPQSPSLPAQDVALASPSTMKKKKNKSLKNRGTLGSPSLSSPKRFRRLKDSSPARDSPESGRHTSPSRRGSPLPLAEHADNDNAPENPQAVSPIRAVAPAVCLVSEDSLGGDEPNGTHYPVGTRVKRVRVTTTEGSFGTVY